MLVDLLSGCPRARLAGLVEAGLRRRAAALDCPLKLVQRFLEVARDGSLQLLLGLVAQRRFEAFELLRGCLAQRCGLIPQARLAAFRRLRDARLGGLALLLEPRLARVGFGLAGRPELRDDRGPVALDRGPQFRQRTLEVLADCILQPLLGLLAQLRVGRDEPVGVGLAQRIRLIAQRVAAGGRRLR